LKIFSKSAKLLSSEAFRLDNEAGCAQTFASFSSA
jgi:hypothetical protein